MFGTFMTVIIIGYIGYYGYNIIHDLYFDKSGEIVVAAHVEEQEVDIKDELESFTRIEADQLPNLVDSLENTEEGSDFFVIKSAFTPAGL